MVSKHLHALNQQQAQAVQAYFRWSIQSRVGGGRGSFTERSLERLSDNIDRLHSSQSGSRGLGSWDGSQCDGLSAEQFAQEVKERINRDGRSSPMKGGARRPGSGKHPIGRVSSL